MSLPRYVELAHAFLSFAQGSFSGEQREIVTAAIVLAGQSLAPADDWTSFAPKRFLRAVADEVSVRIEVAMYLMGFFGWLAIDRRLGLDAAIDLMDRTRQAAPASPLLDELLRRALPHLSKCAA